MGLESRDWYWSDRKRRARQFNPADPASDLPDEERKKLTKRRWQAFKAQEEKRANEPPPKWRWSNTKNDVFLNEPDTPKRQTTHQKQPPRPKQRVKTKRQRNLHQEVYTLRWLLAGSVAINFMALKALYDLAYP